MSWGMELWNTGVGLEVSIIVGNAVISYWEMGLGKGDEGETLCALKLMILFSARNSKCCQVSFITVF